MHYYSFNIKAYHAATAHLKPSEDLAYRRLIDYYMDTERPIPLDEAKVARRLRIGIDPLMAVLVEFFFSREDGWHNAFCDAEILAYHAQAEKNRKNGKKGGRPRKPLQALETLGEEKPVGCQVDATANPQESQQETMNNKPITKNKSTPRKRGSVLCIADLLLLDVPQQVAADWLAIRAKKNLPLTLTAMQQIGDEATKAGLTVVQAITVAAGNSWAGFKAEWMQRAAPTTTSFISDHTDRSWADDPYKTQSFVERHTDPSWREGL